MRIPLVLTVVLMIPPAVLCARGQDQPANGAPVQAPAAPAEEKPQGQDAPKNEPVTPAKPQPPAASPVPAHHRKRPKPTTQDDAPRKVIVREGGAREPAEQIAPDMTPEESTRERQRAMQSLDSADGRLRLLASRELSSQQRETVAQVHNYMNGAHSALKTGDVRRANILAEKAYLLADDLAKH